MIEGAYPAPNGWSLSWRTFCADDCHGLAPGETCADDCQHEVGDLTLYDAGGKRQWIQSGVITQRAIDRAVAKLKRDALAEMQPSLFEMEMSLC